MPLVINPCCVPDDRLDEFFWLAGWLEGEGCFGFYGTPTIVATSTDFDVCQKAASIMGVTSRAVRSRKDRHKQAWRLGVYGEDAVSWMEALSPYLSVRRAAKITRTLTARASSPGQVRGSRVGSAKPRESDIIKIRSLYSSGKTQAEIAASYGVGDGAISDIVTGITWRHVA